MGLIDEKCDGCGDKVSPLVPLVVLDELPSGGTRMLVKYYCKDCAEILLNESEELENEPDDSG